MTAGAGTDAHQYGPFTVVVAAATCVGGRTANADAVSVQANPLGVGAAVVDGIGSSPTVVAAARLAADAAAVVASHRSAQSGILAAAETMPNYPGAPNAVAAVASVDAYGRIEVAHVGDAAAWTWTVQGGLVRWGVDQTAGQHVAHVLANSGIAGVDRQALTGHAGEVIAALDDYVLGSLVRATVSTICWSPLRGDAADPELIVLTSDGIHKPLLAGRIAEIVAEHAGDVQALADSLVHAAVTVPGRIPDEVADNATVAVLKLQRI